MPGVAREDLVGACRHVVAARGGQPTHRADHRLAVQLFEATRRGGRLMLANSMDEREDWLLRPWIIRTYRDLFVNVGYTIESEKLHTATKRGVEFKILMTLYRKPAEGTQEK